MKEQESSHPDAVYPWWRQRWPWLLMLGPVLAVVACAITIVLAFQGFGDQSIVDGGFKRGLVIEKTITPASSSQTR